MSRWIDVFFFAILLSAIVLVANQSDSPSGNSAYAQAPARQPSTRPAARTATRPASPPVAASRPTALVPSIEGTWSDDSDDVLNILQKGGLWTASSSYVDLHHHPAKWQIDNGMISAAGKVTGRLHFTVVPVNTKVSRIIVGSLSPDGKTITGTMKWDGGGRKFTWTKQVQFVQLPMPKLGDSEAALEKYAHDMPNKSLKVVSETVGEKIIELDWYNPGSIGIKGIPGTEADSSFGVEATYTIRTGKIVRIDRP